MGVEEMGVSVLVTRRTCTVAVDGAAAASVWPAGSAMEKFSARDLQGYGHIPGYGERQG